MSTSLQPTISSPSVQPDSDFFRLPREIRDQIYHELCVATRWMYHTFAPSTTIPIPYRNSDRTDLNHAHNLLVLRYRVVDKNPGLNYFSSDDHPTWLLTCKAMLQEGKAQFLSNAEWHFRGYNFYSGEERHWTTRIPLNTTKVKRMELYVENLSNYSIPYYYQGMDTRSDLTHIADLMRDTNMSMHTLRFVGHSYYLRPMSVDCDNQVHNMMRNLMEIFQGVNIEKWEFGIVDRPRDELWVLFEWVAEEGLRLVVKERRRRPPRVVKPEDDLENLLPPGWVVKGSLCDCEGCVWDRSEGEVGGWVPSKW